MTEETKREGREARTDASAWGFKHLYTETSGEQLDDHYKVWCDQVTAMCDAILR
jgi:hypothetical protein